MSAEESEQVNYAEARAESPEVHAVDQAIEQVQEQQMKAVKVDFPFPEDKKAAVGKEKMTVYKAWMEAFTNIQKTIEEQGGKVGLIDKLKFRTVALGRSIDAAVKDLFPDVLTKPGLWTTKAAIWAGKNIAKVATLPVWLVPPAGALAWKGIDTLTTGASKLVEVKSNADNRTLRGITSLNVLTHRETEIMKARKYEHKMTGGVGVVDRIVNKILRRPGR